VSEKSELEVEYVEAEETYLIRRGDQVVGQLEKNPTTASGDRTGANWLFTPSSGEEEEWEDLKPGDDDKAVERAKRKASTKN
jgi:hypothetical protein